ncbi:hypothetical protein B0O95_106147 [Mycetohabitans endofungorum]|uniref:Uncharacterized protein n=1 Tax=Mycetohabitans endofungorum TaxID=417203 RepID=A0A2P5KAL7_9BURK|nr:hypothetical protein B0O95_106147 [Mycetohabitans endofungorum]
MMLLPQFAQLATRFALPWSVYVRLLSVKSPAARAFYESKALLQGWSARLQSASKVGTAGSSVSAVERQLRKHRIDQRWPFDAFHIRRKPRSCLIVHPRERTAGIMIEEYRCIVECKAVGLEQRSIECREPLVTEFGQLGIEFGTVTHICYSAGP